MVKLSGVEKCWKRSCEETKNKEEFVAGVMMSTAGLVSKMVTVGRVWGNELEVRRVGSRKTGQGRLHCRWCADRFQSTLGVAGHKVSLVADRIFQGAKGMVNLTECDLPNRPQMLFVLESKQNPGEVPRQ